jgi:DNA polymerase III delta prime subunit
MGYPAAMKYFNTTGPCDPRVHYMVPPEPRLPQARPLIERGQYFVVHAPRQTGKTTTLRALARSLTAEGAFAALHFSCEAAEAMGEDVGAAERVVLGDIRLKSDVLPPDCLPPDPWPAADAGQQLQSALRAWAASCPRPLVLFFDELDALCGDSLRSILRQLRAGFPDRPQRFPASVVLCGLRDVRDYKAASGGDPTRLGTSSPFNVKVKSLRIGDFTRDEAAELYRQHERETGQPFMPEAVDRAFELTQGQPWLVNALGREVVEELGLEPPRAITANHVEEAKEQLILARATHLDSLVARLMEPRVRRVLGPVLAGELAIGDTFDDDFAYVRDLGLVASTLPVRVANAIYREVVVRVLALAAEASMELEPRSFVLPEGRLDRDRLLREFVTFWKEHGEALETQMPYPEVAPQLVLMAFLQRVVNGGGYVDREYGVGRGRIDLLVRWPFPGDGGRREWQREAIELKVRTPGRPDPLGKGLQQLDGYLERLGLDEGVLVLFDRSRQGRRRRGTFAQARTAGGRRVTVLRL